MLNLRLHQLEGFFYVAQTGNYTKAAQAFPYPIGQSAVYQQVRGLERDLGVELLVQAGPRRAVLTPEGRAFFGYIAPFFQGFSKMVESLRESPQVALRLAADQFLAMETLPQALHGLKTSLPGIQIRLEEGSSREVLRSVLQGEADAGLTHLPSMPPGLHWEPVGGIGVALMVPDAHPLAASGTAPSSAEIAKHPLIVYERESPSRILTERLFKAAGQELRVAAEVTFSQTMRALARSGFAPAFVPFLRPLGKQPSAKKLLPQEPNTITFDMSHRLRGGALSFGVIFRPGMEASRALSALIRALKENGTMNA